MLKLGATEILADYGISSSADQIPQEIIHEGKRCFINFLAVSLYASRDPSLDILLDVFKLEGGKQQSSITGVRARTTIQNAALANGYLGHLEDYDDTHFPTVIHPSSPTLPSSLAIGEHLSASGNDVLVASILGMELCCRIGMAVHPHHYDEGWHITGTCGVFGSAIAAGRIVGLSINQMVSAMGIAGTQAAGVREVFGAMTKPFHPGRSAQSGLLATLLAHRGFSSTETILEGRRGFGAVLSDKCDWNVATDQLGKRWELKMNGLKPYACGVVIHPLIDAMIAFRDNRGINPEDVRSISAKVHPLVIELVNRPNPRVGLEGKFSYQHSIAVGLIDGSAFPAQYTDDRVLDPQVANLRDKVQATIDPRMSEDSTEITIPLQNGTSYEETVLHATGAPENPLSDSMLNQKFRVLSEEVISNSQIEQLLDLLWNLEKVPNINQVMELTRPSRRSRRG